MVAVAVRPRIGTVGNYSFRMFILLYAGLKSSPHVLTQCTSSRTNLAIEFCLYISLKSN